jgi:general stress protein 26
MAIDPQSLERCLKLMDESDAVVLATVDGTRPRLRALWNLRRPDRFPSAAACCRAQGLTALFATPLASSKIRDIRANPAVSLYYCDASSVCGVMLAGRAEVLTDPALKLALWHDGWTIYWPAGAADPDYCVLRVVPSEAAGWWGTEPFSFRVDGA